MITPNLNTANTSWGWIHGWNCEKFKYCVKYNFVFFQEKCSIYQIWKQLEQKTSIFQVQTHHKLKSEALISFRTNTTRCQVCCVTLSPSVCVCVNSMVTASGGWLQLLPWLQLRLIFDLYFLSFMPALWIPLAEFLHTEFRVGLSTGSAYSPL